MPILKTPRVVKYFLRVLKENIITKNLKQISVNVICHKEEKLKLIASAGAPNIMIPTKDLFTLENLNIFKPSYIPIIPLLIVVINAPIEQILNASKASSLILELKFNTDIKDLFAIIVTNKAPRDPNSIVKKIPDDTIWAICFCGKLIDLLNL